MRYSLSILEPDFDELRKVIFAIRGVEGAAYLLCGCSRTDTETRLLVREVVAVKDADYMIREPLRLSIRSDSFVPVAKRAAELGASVMFVHSHPDGISDFSS